MPNCSTGLHPASKRPALQPVRNWWAPLALPRLMVLLAASGCSADPPSSPAPVPVPVASVALFPKADTIYVGETISLSVGLLDSSDNAVYDRDVTWLVSDTTPIGITPQSHGAQVHGRHTGSARISATIDGIGDTSFIAVWTRVAHVTITPKPTALVIGDSIQFTAALTDSEGKTLQGREVAWVADGEASEIIQALGVGRYRVLAGGTTTIVARSEGIQDSTLIRLTPDAPLADLAAGVESGCGVSALGTLYCWGWNGDGQLGLGTALYARYWSMRRSSTGTPVHTLAAGRHSWCALDEQAAAWCWGSDNSGQLGNATGDQACPNGPCRGTPALVGGTPPFDSVTVGLNHDCGVTAAGTGWCWGENVWGELGRGGTDANPQPAAPVVSPVAFVAISAGDTHTCALDASGRAWCWGSNLRGELGRGVADEMGHGVPDTVVGGLRFQVISAGLYHTCGLTTGGLAACWGTNELAQLGLGSPDTLTHPTPAMVIGNAQFSALQSGYAHTCALGAQGMAVCWGKNEFGELGSAPGARDCHWYSFSYPCSGTPLAVTGGVQFVNIRPGQNTTCAMGSDGVGYCWGANSNGELGDQSFTDRAGPTKVAGQP